MTKKELIDIIQEYPDDTPIIIQKDPEGNGFYPLSDYWFGSYKPIKPWYGDAGLLTLTPELKDQGYTEEDVLEEGKPAIFLVPIN